MTTSMEAMGKDAIKPATYNTMTLDKMVDIWSAMRPEQRLFVARLLISSDINYEDGEVVYNLNDKILAISDQYLKVVFDHQELPFRFGTPVLTK